MTSKSDEDIDTVVNILRFEGIGLKMWQVYTPLRAVTE